MTGDQSGKDSSSETAYGKNGNLLQWFIPTSKICDGDILPLDGFIDLELKSAPLCR
jgi:hypothetical protein